MTVHISARYRELYPHGGELLFMILQASLSLFHTRNLPCRHIVVVKAHDVLQASDISVCLGKTLVREQAVGVHEAAVMLVYYHHLAMSET